MQLHFLRAESLRDHLVRITPTLVIACFMPPLLALNAWATPLISRSFVYIDNRSLADPFGDAGLSLHAEIIATDTGGPAALMGAGAGAAARSDNPSFPFSQPFPLFVNPLVRVPEPGGVDFIRFLFISAVDFPSITGTYTLGVRDTSLEVTTATQTLLRPALIAFPTNITASDHSTTPVVTFTDPNPTPSLTGLGRRYQLQIVDDLNVIFYSSDLSATPSFAIPPGLLIPEERYLLRANIFDFDITQGILGVSNPIAAAAREYVTFVPVPGPGSLLSLLGGLLIIGGIAQIRRQRKQSARLARVGHWP